MKEKKVMKMIQEMNERNLRLLVGVQKAGTCKGYQVENSRRD